MNKLCENPFRIFFTIGWFLGILGVIIWPINFYVLGLDDPLILHKHLLLKGFWLCYILGFLMTAIPRFTQSGFCSRKELYISICLISLLLLSFFLSEGQYSFVPMLAIFLFLICFALTRFIKRAGNPPDSFIFIPLAIVMGATAVVLDRIEYGSNFATILYVEGFIMSLILGIGGRLIPGILGHSEIVQKQRAKYEQPLPFHKVISFKSGFSALIWMISFPLELMELRGLGAGLRLLVIVYIAVSNWRLFNFPTKKNPFTFNLWLICWLIVISHIFRVAFDTTEVFHMIFIGSISAICFSIGARVVTAHCASNMAREESVAYWGSMTLFLVLTLFLRVFLYELPVEYETALAVTSSSWIAFMVIWGWPHLRLMIGPQK